MNQAKKFYIDYIKNYIHIIGGSVAIKKQIPSFREPSDLDIMCLPDQVDKILQSELPESIKESDYGNGIFKLTFEDGSKIDLIKSDVDRFEKINIGGYLFLSVKEILKFKVSLIENDIDKNINNENKHIKDILFILKNT